MVRVAKIPASEKATTIIRASTRIRLAERGNASETYDDILERLINQYKS